MPDVLPVNGKVYWEERGLKPVLYNNSTEKYEDVGHRETGQRNTIFVLETR
jgi:hypothetical protein